MRCEHWPRGQNFGIAVGILCFGIRVLALICRT